MDKQERLKMVSAMEFICRNLNNEARIEKWLVFGVADGDIEYGTLCDDEYYIEDDTFSEIMGLFLNIMKNAYKDGLYCDNILSEDWL